jgi:hypothetical protein
MPAKASKIDNRVQELSAMAMAPVGQASRAGKAGDTSLWLDFSVFTGGFFCRLGLVAVDFLTLAAFSG